MSDAPRTPLSYRDAGVDIDAGNALVARIGGAVSRTRRPEVLGGVGGFGALCRLPAGYREPVLVSGTDGVGTKLRLAIDLGRHEDIGIDLVAMCANDIATSGAEPLFFLDYYATGQLDTAVAAAVIGGIARGCERAGCALVGGETAEMPGMYRAGDYDLAGFCVGVVEREAIIDGTRAQPGDALVALASSGAHANGYSLIRAILERSGADLGQPLPGGAQPLAEQLLAPTPLYCRSLLALRDRFDLRAVAHITGGGLPENLPRVLPSGLTARIDTGSWEWPPLFRWLQEAGAVATEEMYRTFNCGVGMVLCVPQAQAEDVIAALRAAQQPAWRIGRLDSGTQRLTLDG